MLYAIRHNETGAFLSQNWMKGASFWEGQQDNVPPRLFSLRGAKAFVASWRQGEVRKESRGYSGNPYDIDAEITIKIVDVGRKASALSIIPVTLSFGEPL